MGLRYFFIKFLSYDSEWLFQWAVNSGNVLAENPEMAVWGRNMRKSLFGKEPEGEIANKKGVPYKAVISEEEIS